MKKYSAIIVTFYPDFDKLFNMVEILLAEKISIVIVNNTPKKELKIDSFINKSNLFIINNYENLGIAKAQNIGIDFLSKNSFYATFFFDQDSTLDKKLIKNLINSLSSKVNVVAPIKIDKSTNLEIPSFKINKLGLCKEQFNRNNLGIIKTDLVISSGILIKMKVFKKVGFFDESLFIDYVDFEWCFRINYFDEKIYIVPSAVLKHKIGKGLRYFLFLRTNSHEPFRTYYKIRNPILLLRRKHIPILWTIKEIILSIKCLIVQIIVDKNRLLHIRKGILGLKDGLIVNFHNI